jgi:AMP nucleosidase
VATRKYHEKEISQREEAVARDTLERYCGSPASEFQPFLLLTNFPRYVQYFAESRKLETSEGSMFKVAHSPKEHITILDFKIGSPAAALVVDLCAHLPIKASILLGMCGGLRDHYKVGEFFVPIAGIRGEGTSDFYFPSEVPAMANFIVQKAATTILEEDHIPYHIGITHTTNKRFWEFNAEFRARLEASRAQAVEMECATLFTASYYHKLPLGALLLISDLPLELEGIKTKELSEKVYQNHTQEHVEIGVKTMQMLHEKMKTKKPKGIFRGRNNKKES